MDRVKIDLKNCYGIKALTRFVGYPQCLMATRRQAGITLEKAAGIQNVFANDWRKAFFKDDKKKVASIPFLRNLIEFTIGKEDPDFVKLTSMLHWKSDSAGLAVSELDKVYNRLCQPTGTSADPKKLVYELIEEGADACMKLDAGIHFENKIVLAIAVRMRAERFATEKIKDPAAVAAIESNQTHALVKLFKEKCPGDVSTLAVLDRVALVTPENIHLNSFMYEPIVDMSDEQLKKLWTDVKALK